MNTSMYNGTTGILTYQEALDVESNNASNVNTIAFKADKVSFADMMYQRGVGAGVSNIGVFKDFSQGGFTNTKSEYDFAIDGNGFFALSNPEDSSDLYYTRSGNFKVATDGYLSTVDGFNVLGVQPVVVGDKITKEFSNHIATSVFVEDDDTIKSVNVFSTDYKKSVIDTGTSGNNYKKTYNNVNDIEGLSDLYYDEIKKYGTNPTPGEDATYQKSEFTLPKNVIGDDQYELEIVINGISLYQNFDESVENTLKLFSDKISQITGITSSVDTATGKITVESLFAGESFNISNPSTNKNYSNVQTIEYAGGSGEKLINELYRKLDELITAQGGKMAKNESQVAKPTNDTIQLEKLQLNMDTLGIHENSFGEIIIKDKNIFLKNGEAEYIVGKLTPMVFANNNGLTPQGSNRYKATNESGEATYVETQNRVDNKILELSTSDLSKTLVNLMVYQKAFDANSKSITTSDELLKTALQLKTK